MGVKLSASSNIPYVPPAKAKRKIKMGIMRMRYLSRVNCSILEIPAWMAPEAMIIISEA